MSNKRFRKSGFLRATTLTSLGGTIGILLGCLIAELITIIIPTFIPLWATIIGFGFSVFLGISVGLWPAWKTSRLDPIEALCYE